MASINPNISMEEKFWRASEQVRALNKGRVMCVLPGVTNGNGSADSPFSTLEVAEDLAVSGRGDTIFLGRGGSTSQSVRLAANLALDKHSLNIIGVCAGPRIGQRSRITGPSTGGTFSPVLTLSANDCYIANLSVFDDYTVDPCALKVTGQRNHLKNVGLQGMGALTGADDANGSSLWIAGGAENHFEDCGIGLSTIYRSAANGELRFTASAKRNTFQGCDFYSAADSATHLFIKASTASDIAAEQWFRDCHFINAPTGMMANTTMTQCMDVAGNAGYIFLDANCWYLGATDWAAADNGNVFGPGYYNGTNLTKAGGRMVALLRA